MTVGQIPKPSRIGSRELLARRLRLADRNTSKRNVLRRTLSAVYPGLQDQDKQYKTYAIWLAFRLTYFQKFPNLTTPDVRLNEYDRTGRHNYYHWDNSKFIADLGVSCNLEDPDFNRYQRSRQWNGLFVWVTPGIKFSWRHFCATLFINRHRCCLLHISLKSPWGTWNKRMYVCMYVYVVA